uniref:Uncharacterized protein n=1 Tax=Opuntia streptacantha TaxID=393608 RepID=A0A7C9EDN3_OPUST
MTAIACTHGKPRNCHPLQLHVPALRFTTKHRLLVNLTLYSPKLRLYMSICVTQPILSSVLLNFFSILSPTPFFHPSTVAFLRSIFLPSFCMCPLTRQGIDICLSPHIQLFQLSIGLFVSFPHLSLVNFDCAQRSGSLSSTHRANSCL